jgi:hypothetical protein
MMNNTISNQVISDVASVIDELTNSDELFTAYDVTCILRRKNLAGGATHWQIKDVVHDYYLTGNMSDNYVRTTTNFTGNSALVYLPYGKGVAEYDTTKHTQGIGSPAVATVKTTPTVTNLQNVTAPVVTNITSDVVVADNRGRITVPKKFIDAVKQTNFVYVNKVNNDAFLTGTNSKNGSCLAIDQYGNVKVSFGKDNAGKKYKFSSVSVSAGLTINQI